MTHTTHTQAPWETINHNDVLTIIANVDVSQEGERMQYSYDVVASCCDEHGETLPNAKANARLIAAAPDMLAALEWAVEAADADQYEQCWYAAAREAISKAKETRLTDGQLFFDAASSVCDTDIFSDLDMETAGRIWRAIAEAKGQVA